jgi:tetratricopeptide (TPR) repeat protein
MSNRAQAIFVVVLALAAVLVGCKSEYLAGAKLHFDQQRYSQALENFDKAAVEMPKSAEVQMWRARALGKLERDEESEAALDKAMELDITGEFKQDIDNTRISFWSARHNAGLTEAAAADEQRPKCEEYRAASQTELQTQCEQEMRGKLESAVERFQRAILFCPDSVKTYSNLGKVFFQLGRQEEGKAMFLKARGMAGDRQDLLGFLFIVFRSLGVQGLREETKEGFQRAIEMFEQAATFTRPPEDMATVYFNLGLAYQALAGKTTGAEQQSAYDSSVASYKKVLAINPDDQEALENLAQLYAVRGAYEEAIAVGRRLVDTEPWRAYFHQVMVNIYMAAGDKEKSVAHGMIGRSLEGGTSLATSTAREDAKKCTGSDLFKTVLSRNEPEQLFTYPSSQGDYSIWFYWTKGRVFIFQHCKEVFRDEFRPVPAAKLQEVIGG